MNSLSKWQSHLLWAITIPTGLLLLAAASAPFVLPRLSYVSDTTRAKFGARSIQLAIEAWQGEYGQNKCPTIPQLVETMYLNPSMAEPDPWGMSYALSCSGGQIVVTSAGPDRKMGSADDIRVSPGASMK